MGIRVGTLMTQVQHKRPLRAIRWALVGLLGTLLLITLFAVALRLIVTDERLKGWIQTKGSLALGQPVSLDSLTLSLTSGVSLQGLKLGHEDGPIWVRTERVEARWSPLSLTNGRFDIYTFAIDGLEISLHAIASELKAQNATKPTQQSEQVLLPHLPTLPSFQWPISLGLSQSTIRLRSLSIRQPGLHAEIENLEVLSFGSIGHGLPNLTVLLNSEKRTRLTIEHDALPLAVGHAPSFALQFKVRENGEVQLRAKTSIELENHPVHFETHQVLSSQEKTLAITKASITVGDHSEMGLTALLRETPTHPQLQIQSASCQLDFDQLAGLLAVLPTPVAFSGKASCNLSPVALANLAPQQLFSLPLAGQVSTQDFSVSKGDVLLHNVRGDISLSLRAGKFRAQAQELILAISTRTLKLGTSTLKLDLATTVDDWLNPLSTQESSANISGTLGAVSFSDLEVHGTRFDLRALSPTALIRGQPSADPMGYSIHVSARSVHSPKFELHQVRTTSQGSVANLAGSLLDTTLLTEVQRVEIVRADQKVRLLGAKFETHVNRNNQSWDLRDTTLSLGTALTIKAKGALTLKPNNAFDFEKFEMHANVSDLSELHSWIEEKTPTIRSLTGSATVDLRLDGHAPIRELLAEAALPAMPTFLDVSKIEQEARPLVGYVGLWMAKLGGELALKTHFASTAQNVNIAHGTLLIEGLGFKSQWDSGKEGTNFGLEWQASKLVGSVAVMAPSGQFGLKLIDSDLTSVNSLKFSELMGPKLAEPIRNGEFRTNVTYRFGKDLNLRQISFKTANAALQLNLSGLVHHPIRTIASGALLRERLPGVRAVLDARLSTHAESTTQLLGTENTWQGGVALDTALSIENGSLLFRGNLSWDQLNLKGAEFNVRGLHGTIPVTAALDSFAAADNMHVAVQFGLGGGNLYLRTGAQRKEKNQRKIYYENLRPYRANAGVQLDYLAVGDYEISNAQFDGRFENGMFRADHFQTELLGGDVLGNLTLQFSPDREFFGSFALQASNIDASNFAKLQLEPGPDSELSADMHLDFFAGASQRDLNLDIHVTQIGKTTLDRFLQLLDPEGVDSQIQKTRDNLKFVKIKALAAWIRHENLNMDLDYTTLLSIPGTDIGFRPINRELLRRYALAEQVIDPYFQVYMDKYLAGPLGWSHADE